MYTLLPSFVLGFHGCDRSVGEAVLAGHSTLIPSSNPYDWLGAGIYFWENNPVRALSYASQLKERPARTKGRIKEPFVIGAIIDLGYCLNLTDEKALLEVGAAHGELAKLMALAGQTMPENKVAFASDSDLLLRQLDCAVFELLHELRNDSQQKSYQSVRSPFLEGASLYPGTRFMQQTHIQICVRDRLCIKGYFRPLNADGTVFQSV